MLSSARIEPFAAKQGLTAHSVMSPPIQSSVRKFTTQQRIAQADEDIALLEQVVRKDMRAFEALYRSYHRRLTRFLDRITRQPHLIEEILDDTMLVVWLQAQTYDRSCRVSTWIFSIAYNDSAVAEGKIRSVLMRADARIIDGPNREGAYTLGVVRGRQQELLQELRRQNMLANPEPAR